MEKSKNKTNFKEILQAIEQIVYTGYLNGDFAGMATADVILPNSPMVQYFNNKLNAIPCVAGSASSGTPSICKHFAGIPNSALDAYIDTISGRWIFPTGASAWFYHYTWSSTNNYLGFTVESKNLNPSKPIYSIGTNQLLILCNISDSPSLTVDGSLHPIKQGHCGPYVFSRPSYNDVYYN